MEIFLDTAFYEEVEEYSHIINGVTTNPSLVSKSNRSIKEIVLEMVKYTSGPISVEVMAEDYSYMLSEARRYTAFSDQVIIKLPITTDGLKACKALESDGIPVNMTLCFSASQAIAAAKCNATYISPFIGRIDDIGYCGVGVIEEIKIIFQNYFKTKILAASIRSVNHIIESAKIGVDAITIPKSVIKLMHKHVLTDLGIEKFKADWKEAERVE